MQFNSRLAMPLAVLTCCLVFLFSMTVLAQQVQSLEYWQQSVEQDPDNAEAWFNLGVLYETGQGIKANKVKAQLHYNKAIKLGYAPAMYNLGSIYAQQKDYATARIWWEKAAELNVPEAQYNMGMLYEKGWGVKVDPEMSAHWYQRAAETALKKYMELYHRSRSQLQMSTAVDQNAVSVFDRLRIINTAYADDTGQSQAVEDQSANEQVAQQNTAAPENSSQDNLLGWPWVYAQPEDNYTIQLFATKEQTKTGKFIQQYALTERAKTIAAMVKGTQYYKVLLGSFSEWNDAAVEIGTFPQDLRDQRPWVRKFSSLYPELPEGTETTARSLEPENQQSQAEVQDSDTSSDVVDESQAQQQQDQQQQQAPQQDQVQAKIEQSNSQTHETSPAPATEQSKENEQAPEDKDAEPDVAEQPDTQADESATVASVDDSAQSDNAITAYAKLQLASKGLSDEVKFQLKTGLEAMAAEDHETAFEHLSILAESGLPEAQYQVAMLYSQGNGVELDVDKAFDLLKLAAEQGHPYAQQSLANFYIKGIGVEANSSLGAYWQQTAADNIKKLENL